MSVDATNQIIRTSQCIQPTNIKSLPFDVFIHIFEKFSFRELCNVKLVCKKWHQITLLNYFGNKFLKPMDRSLVKNEIWMKTYQFWLEKTQNAIIFDASHSMKNHFAPAINLARSLCDQLLPISIKVRLYIFNVDYTFHSIKKSSDLDKHITPNIFGGSTDLANVISKVFKRHSRKRLKCSKIFIITDCCPNDGSKVVKKIKNNVKKAMMNDTEMRIRFFQVDNDDSENPFVQDILNIQKKFDNNKEKTEKINSNIKKRKYIEITTEKNFNLSLAQKKLKL